MRSSGNFLESDLNEIKGNAKTNKPIKNVIDIFHDFSVKKPWLQKKINTSIANDRPHNTAMRRNDALSSPLPPGFERKRMR